MLPWACHRRTTKQLAWARLEQTCGADFAGRLERLPRNNVDRRHYVSANVSRHSNHARMREPLGIIEGDVSSQDQNCCLESKSDAHVWVRSAPEWLRLLLLFVISAAHVQRVYACGARHVRVCTRMREKGRKGGDNGQLRQSGEKW